MKAWDDAVEFCDRAVHVNPCHVKALSRRAVAHKALGNTVAALKDLQAAARVEPVSQEVAKQLDELTREIKDRETEKEIEKLKHGRVRHMGYIHRLLARLFARLWVCFNDMCSSKVCTDS